MSRKRIVEVELNAQAGHLEKMRALIEKIATAMGGTPELGEKLAMAMDEGCNTIIRNAYKGDASGKIVLTVDRIDKQLIFRLRDFAGNNGSSGGAKSMAMQLRLVNSIMDQWTVEKPMGGEGSLLVMKKTIS